MLPTLKLEKIVKIFPSKDKKVFKALNEISLTVYPGQISALVGPDGAGKTTLIRLCAGLLRANSGTILFQGKPFGPEQSAARAQIGYMPQKFGLYEDLMVEENLDLAAKLRGLPEDMKEERFERLLKMANLVPFRRRLAGALSGGMKQKLVLISTLIVPPSLLLLDEPTVGVDPLSRKELWEMLDELVSSSDLAAVVGTSYLDEAEKCSEVCLLFGGQALARGSPKALTALSEGRSFLAKPKINISPRVFQSWLMKNPATVDAVPQGGSVRLIVGEQGPSREALLKGASEISEIKAVKSRLEDSFLLLLKNKFKPSNSFAFLNSQTWALNPPRPKAKDGEGLDSDNVIETKGVWKFFGSFAAVKNVGFTVRRGEVFGLLGPNGAGKTTTFRLLCGLISSSRGEIKVAGVDASRSRREARKRLGYVAQKFSLYGDLTVKENLDFFAGVYGLKGREKKKRLEEIVEDFSLTQRLNQAANDLPGGYQKRLAMAVGLIHRPSVLFLDEPTSGADPLARREFWLRVSDLAESGVTIVVTTHFMEEAEYCDRLLIQDSGEALAWGAPDEIRERVLGANLEEATIEQAFIEIVRRSRIEKGPIEEAIN